MIKKNFCFLILPLSEMRNYFNADKKLREKIEILSLTKEENHNLVDEDLINLNYNSLRKVYNETLRRREFIEDKAKNLNIVLTIFITLAFGNLKYIIEILLKMKGNYFFYCFLILYFYLLICLGISSYFAIEAFSKISRVYICNYSLKNKKKVLFDYKKNITLNRKQNLRKTNCISLVNTNIKYSFILMIVLIIFVVFYEAIFNQNGDSITTINFFEIMLH